jgi:lipopolysaccharide export LptBFGC system permease protein LptF
MLDLLKGLEKNVGLEIELNDDKKVNGFYQEHTKEITNVYPTKESKPEKTIYHTVIIKDMEGNEKQIRLDEIKNIKVNKDLKQTIKNYEDMTLDEKVEYKKEKYIEKFGGFPVVMLSHWPKDKLIELIDRALESGEPISLTFNQ